MLDERQRTERARTAALVAGRKRTDSTKERDRVIGLLHRFLAGHAMSKHDYIEAYNCLQNLGKGVSLPDGITPNRFLADAFGVTRQRVHQIVKNQSNSSITAKNNDFDLIG